jgi:leucyl aminopeptidase (aminopeptidase T)
VTELPAYATNAIRCLDVRAGERVQVICDEEALEPARNALAAAAAAGASATLTLLPDACRPFLHTPPWIVESVAATDVLLLWLGRDYPEETRRRLWDRVFGSQCRAAFGSNMDASVFEHEMSADYGELAARCRSFADALAGASRIRVTAPSGTDLEVSIEGRSWVLDDGRLTEPGQFGNLPAGEIFIAPVEDSANGVLVVDAAIAAIGRGLVDEPVRIQFRDGRVTEVSGGRAADVFRELITAPGADVIAELGIGTNEKARMQGSVITDEKVLGSAHVAVGNNTGSYGGVNESDVHCDGCFRDATIEADGRVVIDRGRLVGSAA